MKKYIKHWFLGVLMSFISFSSIAQTPIIETYQPDSINGTSAVLRGKVKRSPNGALLLSRGFALKTANSNTYNYFTISSQDSIISFNATGLLINTRYQFAAIALTMDSLYMGDTIGFNTLNPSIVPQIITSEVTNLTSTSATLNGNLVNVGNPLINEKGFLFSTNPNLTFATAEDTIPLYETTIGNFSYSKTGLITGITYYYRAYAINQNTIVFGDIISFITPNPNVIFPQVVTFTPNIIDEHNATLLGAILSLGTETISSIGFDLKKYTETTFVSHTISPYSDTFYLNLNNLDPSTTYIYRAYAITSVGKSFGETKNFVTPDEPEVFETYNPTNITANSAKLNGYIFNSTTIIQAFGFAIKEGEGNYSFYDISSNFSLPCNLTYTLTNLIPYQNYTYKVYGVGIDGVYYGNEISFRTNSIPSIVKTNASTNLTYNSVKLNGRLSNSGTPNIIEKGFIYSTYSSLTFNNSTKIIISGTNVESYIYYLTGLNENTQYYYRSFSISPIDTNYGAIVNFTTLVQGVEAPIISTFGATNVTYNSAQISGSIYGGNQIIISKGFQYKPENDIDYITVPISGETSIQTTLINLSPNTNYQYRTFASSYNTTYFGDELEFTTTEIPMILTTNQPTSITTNSATLNGNIYDGTEIVLFRGFEWKLVSDTSYQREFILEGQIGDISLILEDLTPNTEYSYKVFGKTELGFFYGNEINFRTNEILNPFISDVTISNIDTNSATFNGSITEGDTPIIYSGFLIKRWGQEDYISHPISNNVLDITIDTLEEGTTYYVEIFAFTSSGINRSATNSFRTLGTHNIGFIENESDDRIFSIFPNPSNSIINIRIKEFNKKDSIMLMISDIKGKIIDQKQIYASTTTYDVSEFAKGIYTITLISNNAKHTKKLIVK